MNIRECVVCGLEVDTKKGTIIRHTPDHGCKVKHGAGHYSHALCLDPDVDLSCAACVSVADGAGAAAAAAPEPVADRDYIDFPLEQTRMNELRKRWLVPLVNYRRHREDISDPVALVRLGPKICPVPWLIKEKQIGLHHILEAGGLIDDFLSARYKIGDLQHFQDLDPARTPSLDRRQRALEALGVTAEHLRDHRDALPIAKMREDYGTTPQFIHEVLGLHIDRTAGLQGWRAGERWTTYDLTYLGFSFQHVLNMGLACREHWDQMAPTDSEMTAMGATPADIDALPYCLSSSSTTTVDAQEFEEMAPEPVVAQRVFATPRPAVTAFPPKRKIPFGLKKKP